ncbi:MAG: DUF4132 domain-containing protein [Tannerellaceae bacterium]|jgi:hypothetical protein|nr:DUF4132 domain-containing protein [Tannerellaceae bacterium]
MLDSEISSKADLFTKDNGFGLYDPEEEFVLPTLEPDKDFDLKKTFPLLNELLFQRILLGRYSGAFILFEKLNDLITKHASYEYVNKYGKTCLLGDIFIEVKDAVCIEGSINCYPLPEVWKEFYRHEIKDSKSLLQLLFILSSAKYAGYDYGIYPFMNKEFMPEIIKFYGFNPNELTGRTLKLSHYDSASRVIHLLADIYLDASYSRKVSRNILASFFPLMNKRGAKKMFAYETYNGKEEQAVFICQHASISYWMYDLCNKRLSGQEFADCFTIRYNYYRKLNFPNINPLFSFPKSYLTVFDFGKACDMGMIPESEVIKELMVRPNAEESLRLASSYLFDRFPRQKEIAAAYGDTDFSKLKKTLEKVIDRIVTIELKRGEAPTEVSSLAMKLERMEGASLFVAVLKATGKDSLGKADYYTNLSHTRREVFSKLLRCCYPSGTDTAETLKELLKGTNITGKRLVEAAVYAPQWAEIIEDCLDWKGLPDAVYYFHAHCNEWYDNKKKTIISRYTPVKAKDFQYGAFDIEWFHEVYREMGKKRFEMIYNAAAYISSGTAHARLRRCMDAVGGKMKTKEVKAEIEKNRNRDLLISYCLIPLNKHSKKDLAERYLYLQQFLKESKTFSSQRQESEKKAVETALQNLARNAGYTDVTRLKWSVEMELMKEFSYYFTPQEHRGVDIYVEIDEEGKPARKYMKAGKPLTVIPNRLRKYPYMQELRNVEKELSEHYICSQITLEQMMEDKTVLLVKELDELARSPITGPLIKRLVFITNDGTTGFYTNYTLLTCAGESFPQQPSAEIRIAHPVDLHKLNVWKLYHDFLLEKEISQPVEQVFRTLYQKTEEEQTIQQCRRCGGNRIQPKKAAGALESRRWTPSYAGGMQKIYYKENIIALMHAPADWFAPADMEVCTLEYIAFYKRKPYKPIPLNEVPDIIFSEVIRDIDWAAGIAHAGKTVSGKRFGPLT